MAVATTTALVAASLAVTAYSAYESYQAAGDAEDAQKEQSRIAGNQSKIDEAAKRRQQIREQRIRVAQIAQAAENTGVSGSSGALGSTGALQSITASNIASSFGANRTTDRLTSLSNTISSARQQQGMWNSVGSVSGGVFQSLGGAPALMDGISSPAATQTVRPVNTRNMNRSRPV